MFSSSKRKVVPKVTLTEKLKTFTAAKLENSSTNLKLSSAIKLSKIKSLQLPRPDILHIYPSAQQVNGYLNFLASQYPRFVKVHNIGVSHEEREIKAIEIDCTSLTESKCSSDPASFKSNSNTTFTPFGRNYVFIEGGIHGREWISVSVALHCIYQLTEKQKHHKELLRKLRFFIVPLSNPDGYTYSRTKNRRWRKNRRPSTTSVHVGTDCNRNWDFHWAEGSGLNMHMNTYKGNRPFSEPETMALHKIMMKLAPNILMVLSLHSHAQSIMYPWGYCKTLPDSWEQLHKVATAGRNAIKSFSGRRYRIGSIASIIKRTVCGTIVDYAYGELNVPVALVVELPSSDYGFYPPSYTISPIGHESWSGILAMCKCANKLWNETPSECV